MSTRRDFLLQTAVGMAAAGVQVGQASAAVSALPAIDPKGSLKTVRIAKTDLIISRIMHGWGSFGGAWDESPIASEDIVKGERILKTAFEQGITFFDHADVYAFGKAESVFGQALKRSPGLRDKIVIQTKCGIHLSKPTDSSPLDDPHRFDFSYEHIVSAAEGSLKRLGTDRIDLLLLHRPDPLMEPDEVAKAFERLHSSGKVRYFGLSNHTAAQIDLLKTSVRQPLVVNQVELGLLHPYLITEGLDFNRQGERRLAQSYVGAAGLLDYCRLHEIQIQAYHPVRGLMSKSPDAPTNVKDVGHLLKELAQKKSSSPFALALAWLLRHPAGIVPISGAEKPEHIVENCTADKVNLDRREWYALLYAATGLPSTSVL